MRVVFFDNLRETYHSVDGVIKLSSTMTRLNGRITKVWLIAKEGGYETFKQKDFLIYRVE